MRSTRLARLRRLVMPFVAAAALAMTLPAGATAAGSCAHADQLPQQLSGHQLRTATLCLINQQRARHGLRALRADARLARAAARHSRDMVTHRYFAHDSRTGARFSSRIARTGWMKGRSRWSVGENLAWGTGARATPRAIVRAWMHSAPHRANILQRNFRLIGIGIHRGAPIQNAAAGATYTTDFGS